MHGTRVLIQVSLPSPGGARSNWSGHSFGCSLLIRKLSGLNQMTSKVIFTPSILMAEILSYTLDKLFQSISTKFYVAGIVVVPRQGVPLCTTLKASST